MRKSTMVCLIVAGALAVVGLAFFAIGISFSGGFIDLNMTTNEYKIKDTFNDISIHVDTADVRILYTEDDECRIECYENPGREQHVASVKDGVLTVERFDQRRWYQKVFDYGKTPAVTVYLPAQLWGDLSIKVSTGDVNLGQNLTFKNIEIKGSTADITCDAVVEDLLKIQVSTGDIDLNGSSGKTVDLAVTTGEIEVNTLICTDLTVRVSTGDAELSEVICKTFTSTGSTGDLELEHVMAEEFSIERSTGDLNMERCEAGKIWIKTDTGDVRGTLLSDMVFYVTTDTGKVSVPKSTTGGLCEVTTDTGNITFSVMGK